MAMAFGIDGLSNYRRRRPALPKSVPQCLGSTRNSRKERPHRTWHSSPWNYVRNSSECCTNCSNTHFSRFVRRGGELRRIAQGNSPQYQSPRKNENQSWGTRFKKGFAFFVLWFINSWSHAILDGIEKNVEINEENVNEKSSRISVTAWAPQKQIKGFAMCSYCKVGQWLSAYSTATTFDSASEINWALSWRRRALMYICRTCESVEIIRLRMRQQVNVDIVTVLAHTEV